VISDKPDSTNTRQALSDWYPCGFSYRSSVECPNADPNAVGSAAVAKPLLIAVQRAPSGDNEAARLTRALFRNCHSERFAVQAMSGLGGLSWDKNGQLNNKQLPKKLLPFEKTVFYSTALLVVPHRRAVLLESPYVCVDPRLLRLCYDCGSPHGH
jgi:hypothetical protein